MHFKESKFEKIKFFQFSGKFLQQNKWVHCIKFIIKFIYVNTKKIRGL